MSDLAILVPVLGRPHRVAPLLDSIESTTPGARVLFLADPNDLDEIAAITGEQRSLRRPFSVDLETTGGNYAEKIGRGVSLTSEPLVFTGADDLEPKPGWYEAAKARCMVEGVEVVGVNDLIDRRPARAEHATHFLMTRKYAEQPCIDGSPGPFFTGYDHSWCDNELIATATARGVYGYAADAHVRHEHPMNETAPDDDVYRKGRAQFHQDRRIFQGRVILWSR